MLQKIIYFVSRWALFLTYKIGWRIAIRGVEKIPLGVPVILAPNHRSYADPPILGLSVRRQIHFMAKQELFRFPPFAWLITQYNAHPINRANSRAALRGAVDILRQGHALVMFPEGRRMKTDELGPAKGGVGLLAKKSGALVVPVYIKNSGHIWSFKKLAVTFGAAMDPKKYATHKALSNDLMKEIQKLKEKNS